MNLSELTWIFSDFQAEYGVPPRILYLASREREELRHKPIPSEQQHDRHTAQSGVVR